MAKNKEKEEVKTFDEIKAENQALYSQLTNKNQDYMFQLNSRLDELDYDATKKEYVFNEMLLEMIAAQESSIPARRIYGTVSEQADNILDKKVSIDGKDSEKSDDKLLYLDGALLMGGAFNLIQGFGAMTSDSMDAQIGIVQVLLNFLLGGLAVLVLTRYAPKPGQTKGLLKYGLATVVVVVTWVVAMALILTVLRPVNIILPGAVVIGIGALGLLGKWYFKKKFDIKGTLF